jgi:hypothetical protein
MIEIPVLGPGVRKKSAWHLLANSYAAPGFEMLGGGFLLGLSGNYFGIR